MLQMVPEPPDASFETPLSRLLRMRSDSAFANACGSKAPFAHFRRAFCSKTPRTASVIAVTPVSMVGFGTGANSGE
jgi:hypothetical protein